MNTRRTRRKSYNITQEKYKKPRINQSQTTKTRDLLSLISAAETPLKDSNNMSEEVLLLDEMSSSEAEVPLINHRRQEKKRLLDSEDEIPLIDNRKRRKPLDSEDEVPLLDRRELRKQERQQKKFRFEQESQTLPDIEETNCFSDSSAELDNSNEVSYEVQPTKNLSHATPQQSPKHDDMQLINQSQIVIPPNEEEKDTPVRIKIPKDLPKENLFRDMNLNSILNVEAELPHGVEHFGFSKQNNNVLTIVDNSSKKVIDNSSEKLKTPQVYNSSPRLFGKKNQNRGPKRYFKPFSKNTIKNITRLLNNKPTTITSTVVETKIHKKK